MALVVALDQGIADTPVLAWLRTNPAAQRNGQYPIFGMPVRKCGRQIQ